MFSQATSGEVHAKRKNGAIVCIPECDKWIGVTVYPRKGVLSTGFDTQCIMSCLKNTQA